MLYNLPRHGRACGQGQGHPAAAVQGGWRFLCFQCHRGDSVLLYRAAHPVASSQRESVFRLLVGDSLPNRNKLPHIISCALLHDRDLRQSVRIHEMDDSNGPCLCRRPFHGYRPRLFHRHHSKFMDGISQCP